MDVERAIMEQLLSGIAGNIILAPILVWFMFKYSALVDRMITSQKEIAVVLAKLESAVNNGNGIMVETRGVMLEAKTIMSNCRRASR